MVVMGNEEAKTRGVRVSRERTASVVSLVERRAAQERAKALRPQPDRVVSLEDFLAGKGEEGDESDRSPAPVVRAVFGDNARKALALFERASALDEGPMPTTLREAENLYRMAVALDPMLRAAMVGLGGVRFRLGDHAEAEAWWTRAIAVAAERKIQMPEALYNLGILATERRRWSDARDLFRQAIDADPDFADAHFHLAEALEKDGSVARARVHWKRYLELGKDEKCLAAARARVEQRFTHRRDERRSP